MGQPLLMEDDQKHMDDVPAVRDALMSPRRLSKLLFGPTAERQLPRPEQAQTVVERSWADYQAGVLGDVIAALPGLLRTAQELEDLPHGDQRRRGLMVSARTHHLAATTLAKIGESDLSWLAAERAMRAADESEQ